MSESNEVVRVVISDKMIYVAEASLKDLRLKQTHPSTQEEKLCCAW
jgi:hypothetical protein